LAPVMLVLLMLVLLMLVLLMLVLLMLVLLMQWRSRGRVPSALAIGAR
jgi:hypothetical protein